MCVETVRMKHVFFGEGIEHTAPMGPGIHGA